MVDALGYFANAENDEQALVIDIGSNTVKIGFSGEDTPRLITRTLVGTPKHPGIMIGMDQREFYSGDDAWSKKHLLNLSEPVTNGVVTNYPDL
jgi:actin beta/gamma 1